MNNKEKIEKFISLKMPRWFNYLYAFLNRYFWLSCPICNKNFGGHEALDEGLIMNDISSGQAVCPRCLEKTKEINEKNNCIIKKLIIL
jgi:hypothetical protein